MHRFEDSCGVEARWAPALDRWLGESYGFHVASEAEQWRGIDRLAVDDTGELVGIDYKCDEKARQTGNVFLETVSNDVSGRQGWLLTTEARWIFYFVVPDQVLIFRTERLREALPAWCERFPTRRVDNGHYHTAGVCVPLADAASVAHRVSLPARGDRCTLRLPEEESVEAQSPQLNQAQRRAVELAVSEQVMVLTGGPGTGKTTTCREILAHLEAHGGRIACAAPTGKASKRLQEQTERPASTIHRLLCWSPQEGRFTVDADAPLDADVVLLDEVSMVDTTLMHALLVALRGGTKLILVGDVDQLPSIGPGNVLRDVIESGAVPVVRLDQVYRQSERSWILVNAQHINAGEPIHIDNAESEDFFFIEHDDATRAAATIIELVTKTIPEQHGLDPIKDIQVLCPQRRGPVGVHVFNDELQTALNPPAPRKPEWRSRGGATFREGDKVIHIKNNYNLGVFNGEVGVINTIGKDFLSVDFDDRTIVYDRTDIGQLQLCYASTIHKSQGSEYPCVVVPVHSTNAFMLSRPLLYTAVTRGQRFVYLVGDRKGLKRAIKNDDVTKRHTGLAERLAAAGARDLASTMTDNGAEP